MKAGLVLAIAVMMVAPVDASAQGRWPLGFEVSAGPASNSYRGERYMGGGSDGFAADLLLAYAFGAAARGRPVLAISHGGQGPGAMKSECIPKPDGGCVPGFPDLMMTGLLIGYETASGNLRIAAGPTDIYLGDASLAWQARANAFLPVISHISVGVTARVAHLPRYDGRSINLLSGGLVLRIR